MLPEVNEAYFKGINLIPNAEQSYIDIPKAIEEYTPDFYMNVFGYEFYKSLQDNYDSGATDSIYYKIMHGSEFTVSGVVYKWDGLINDREISALADYIWLEYIEEIWNNTTVGGVVQIVPTESKQDSQFQRLVKVSNRMEKQIEMLYNFIYYSTDSELESVKNADYPYKFKELNWLGI